MQLKCCTNEQLLKRNWPSSHQKCPQKQDSLHLPLPKMTLFECPWHSPVTKAFTNEAETEIQQTRNAELLILTPRVLYSWVESSLQWTSTRIIGKFWKLTSLTILYYYNIIIFFILLKYFVTIQYITLLLINYVHFSKTGKYFIVNLKGKSLSKELEFCASSTLCIYWSQWFSLPHQDSLYSN